MSSETTAAPITIKTRPRGDYTEVEGFVGTSSVMTLSNHIDGVWCVSGSSCLPVDFQRAVQHLECMRRVFHTAAQHGACPAP